MDPDARVIILVADGARPDALQAAMEDGTLPALKRLRNEGALHTITTVFPSVTGPAYTPFLMGCHPGSVGLPGLRWYDRTRSACGWPGHARSYVGAEMRHMDRDLTPPTQTLFELAPSSLGALNVISRGLPTRQRIGQGIMFATRTAATHFHGNVLGWLEIDRDVGDILVRRVREERPAFTFAAFTGIDKTSHAAGHEAPIVREAMQIVDSVAARLREDAERAGTWEQTHLWVVSDHGHSPLRHHEDLAGTFRSMGLRVLAHPWVFTPNPEVAVMVSGNAMAHIYVNLDRRTRPYWPACERHWNSLIDEMLSLDSVDLLLVPTAPGACDVYSGRGSGKVTWTETSFTYRHVTGNPLGVSEMVDVNADASYHVTIDSDYPDALVQIARLCDCPRSGDLILSAARDWDFRAKYEPIPHVSSHGALHREHMRVPLLTNRPTTSPPKRTVDIMPSAARILGIDATRVEGVAFV